MNSITPLANPGNPIVLSITHFERNNRPDGNRVPITWPDLCERVASQTPTATTKDGLPLIKLATFVGDHRNDANLEAIYGVEGDYDAELIQPDAAAATLRKAGITALIYTSPSHRPGAPRWRVLCPLSRPYDPIERYALVGRLNGVLGGILALESFTASQAFYVGSLAGGHPVQSWRTEGRCIDLIERLQVIAPYRHLGPRDDRKPLGTDKAPSWEAVTKALSSIDPDELDYPEWRNVSFAFRQAATGLDVADELVRLVWDCWCVQYRKNNKIDNDKLWKSADNGTNVGWAFLRSKTPPSTQAELIFGNRMPITGEITPLKDIFDEPLFGKLAGSTVSTELVQHIKDAQLPIAFDLFKQRQVKRKPMPWDRSLTGYPKQWTDDDNIYLQAWFHRYELKPAMEIVRYAARLAGLRNEFNPVLDYLNGLQWDGTRRIDDLFTRYFSASNAQFARTVGAKFLIGMIARAFEPGCKRDEVIVLEGEQGTRKSTALSILATDEYFSDDLPNLHDKEAAQHLQGLWLIEIAELAAMRRSEIEDVKRFIATRIDKFRPPYGHHVIDSPRTAVVAATTNDDRYLKDPTRARRFWPIKCGAIIDTDGLRRDRDQLFAEAVVRYRAKERYWLDETERTLAEAETVNRQEIDPWVEPIARHCAAMDGFPIAMEGIFQHALNMPRERQNAAVNKRVVAILRTLNYRRRQLQRGGPWFYVK